MCVASFAEWNNFGHSVGDTALKFSYDWSTADIKADIKAV
jgi:hypothetical protein